MQVIYRQEELILDKKDYDGEILKHYIDSNGNSGGGLVGWFISKNGLEYSEWHGIVCESLMKAVKTHDPKKGSISTYFNRIARNDMMNELRKKKDLLGYSDSAEKENICLEHNDVYSIELQEALSLLSERKFTIVNLLLSGYNQTEIASLLGIYPGTVRRNIIKIREELGGML